MILEQHPRENRSFRLAIVSRTPWFIQRGLFPGRREFHVSREARRRYQLDDFFFTITGHVVFANFHAARLFTQKLNAHRDIHRHPEAAISTAEVITLGLIDELQHYLLDQYRQTQNPAVFQQLLAGFEQQFGARNVEEALLRFLVHFPPLPVYRGEQTPEQYLAGSTEGLSNRELVLEELILLWLENANPALERFRDLFDDAPLEETPVYKQLPRVAPRVLSGAPGFGPEGENLWDVLQEHIRRHPTDLKAQLEYLKSRWRLLLKPLEQRLLVAGDVIREEERIFHLPPPGAPPPPPPLIVPEYPRSPVSEEDEPEQYSPDVGWMPRLVLMAKHTLVWLDQLSRRYGRPINRLDEIPDEELDRLQAWGFNGLWLIGIWERSRASRKIKHLCGNPDAEASAYAVYDYQVAERLGGEAAFQNLKQRCWQRGIRLAGDMVPNHTAIDGRWVLEHPDWFIQLPSPPYPSYTFHGPELSEHPRYSIKIEDHYYDRSDAAVVFRWEDRQSGQVRYIYHGNDGTSMPWNDTAQLNYLLAEVREAVIQQILELARKLPIIRFDAAMTLTKRHFQRLWFPEPGKGGDIPSRAEHGLTREEFDRLMPREFWREVVDRVAEEAPETLLLAEAFWLMEGYFVRTLGMHRVYNSAFMNMLKAEENEKFRQLIKNTLAYDPEILKRYVNFMSNPDEEPAAVQFGKGDKYFGVCAMLATLPGLPMFGHGQVEGFVEKYGMEFARAYLDEQPDQALLRRHEEEIFPLLRQRALFAEVAHFAFFDCRQESGRLVEDVFAYANSDGNQHALMLYNNRWRAASGWIKESVPVRRKEGPLQGKLTRVNIGEALGLTNRPGFFCIYREHPSGLEYLRPSRDFFERGFPVELKAYQYRLFWEFREVEDDPQETYWKLARQLGGRGVASIEEEKALLALAPVHDALRQWLNPVVFQQFKRLISQDEPVAVPQVRALSEVLSGVLQRLQAEDPRLSGSTSRAVQAAHTQLAAAVAVVRMLSEEAAGSAVQKKRLAVLQQLWREAEPHPALALFTWSLLAALDSLQEEGARDEQPAVPLRDAWRMPRVLREFFQQVLLEELPVDWLSGVVTLLSDSPLWRHEPAPAKKALARLAQSLFEDATTQRLLGVNRFNDRLWFHKEQSERLALLVGAIGAQQQLVDLLQRSRKWKQALSGKTPPARGRRKKAHPDLPRAVLPASGVRKMQLFVNRWAALLSTWSREA
ncbi:MAG: alpha-amylase, partial [Calditrichaeota bacterium]